MLPVDSLSSPLAPPTVDDSSTAADDFVAQSPSQDVTDHHAWATGTFEIVSVDKTRFMVPEYIMLSARYVPRPVTSDVSAVLADAHSCTQTDGEHAGRRRIELDRDFETADVVEKFLTLVTKGEIHVPKGLAGITQLVHFLKKWGCDAALASLLQSLRAKAAMAEVHPRRAFILAAQLDDLGLAKAALQNPKWDNSRTTSNPLTDSLENRFVFDPMGWSHRMWREAEKLPNLDYIFALSRALQEVVKKGDLGATFVKYLTAAKEERRMTNGEYLGDGTCAE
jgi:hypothetical protein